MARTISGITINIDGNTTGLQNALKQVDSQLKTTQAELKNVDKRLKFNPSGIELLRQKQRDLQTAIKQTSDRLAMLKQAQSNATKGSAEWDAIQREINDTEAELKRLESEYSKFGSVGSQVCKLVSEKMKSIGDSMQRVGKELTMKVTLPIVAVGVKAVKSFAEVDKTMQLTNKTMNNTEEQAEALNKAMEEAAANSIFGMTDAADATLNFARAGLTAEQAAAALAPAMNLAAGEGGNLDTVSAGLVATINGFQGSFEEAGHYADVFAAACNNSALDIDSLSGAMSTAAPIFKTAGYTIEDATLYMGIMANNGIEASEGANALKTGLAKLIDPAKEGQQWMKKLGISVTNADGSMKDSITIQKELNGAFSGLSESEQIAAASAIFGKNQMAKWLALINTAPKDVEELSQALNESKGTTQEMADAMMEGFGGSIEKMKSSLNVLMTSLGRLAAQYLTPVIEKIQGWIDKFNSLDDGTKKTIVKIAGIVAAVGPLLVIGGKIMGVLSAVTAGIGFLLTPIGGLVLAMGAAIAITVLIVKNWDKLKKVAQKLGKEIKKVWDNMKKSVVNAAKAMKDKTVQAWNEIKTKVSNLVMSVKNFVVNTWNNLKAAVTNTMTALKTAVVNAWNNLKTAVINAVNSLKTAVSTAWTNLKTAVTNTANSLKTAVTNTWDSLKTAVVNTVNLLKTTVQTAWDNLKTAVTNTVNKLKTALTDAWNNIKTTVTDKVNSLKTSVVDAWTNLKSTVEQKVQNLKQTLSEKWEGIKSDISGKVQSIYSTVTSWFESAKSTVVETVQNIKNEVWKKWDGLVSDAGSKMQEWYNKISSWCSSAIQRANEAAAAIRNALSLDTSLSGGAGMGTRDYAGKYGGGGGHPTQYATAYHNPVMFTQPTVLATPTGMKQFGDGNGAEIVMGLNKLRELVGSYGNGNVTINVYAQPGMDVNQLADAIQNRFIAQKNQRRLAYA